MSSITIQYYMVLSNSSFHNSVFLFQQWKTCFPTSSVFLFIAQSYDTRNEGIANQYHWEKKIYLVEFKKCFRFFVSLDLEFIIRFCVPKWLGLIFPLQYSYIILSWITPLVLYLNTILKVISVFCYALC